MHDSRIELNLEDFQFTDGYEQPLLTEGQAVVICDGILERATGVVVNMSTPGHFLVSLGEPNSYILARFPAHLVRAN